MKSSKLHRAWVVAGSLPSTQGQSWRRNVSFTCIADTAANAIALALQREPELVVDRVVHGEKTREVLTQDDA